LYPAKTATGETPGEPFSRGEGVTTNGISSAVRRAAIAGLVQFDALFQRLLLIQSTRYQRDHFLAHPFPRNDSVRAHQYLVRGGVSHAVPRAPGLVVTFGGRWEGVAVRDLLGSSNGFRRPGYAISGDSRRYVFSCDVPWAIERNLRRSVPKIMNAFRDSDASFADYTVTLGILRRF